MDGKTDKQIIKTFGSLSGYDIDKAGYVTLEDPEVNHTPGIKEYPLTIECEVVYQQDQDLDKMPEEVIRRYYSDEEDVGNFHTAYIGKIVAAYIIKD